MTLVTISDFPDYIDASGGQATGAFATVVKPDSAAAKAGFKEGDTIIRVDTKEVRNLRGLNRQLRRASEETVTVTVFRGYEEYEFSLTK